MMLDKVFVKRVRVAVELFICVCMDSATMIHLIYNERER